MSRRTRRRARRRAGENPAAGTPAVIGIRTPRARYELWARNGQIFVRTTAVAPGLPEAAGEALEAIDCLARVARSQSADARIAGLVRGARDAIRAVDERFRGEQRLK